MIPSLVVSEIRRALIEYLATTFALSGDDVRGALTQFLTDQTDGIFRGPYVRVRTPFEAVDADWERLCCVESDRAARDPVGAENSSGPLMRRCQSKPRPERAKTSSLAPASTQGALRC